MRLRHLKIRINTDHGPYGTDIEFPNGLVVIRAENSMGKSTCIRAIMVALGLEDLLTMSKKELPLPHVMRNRLQSDKLGRKPAHVIESDIFLEIESLTHNTVVLRRSVKGPRDKNLVEVTFGPALSKRDAGPFPSEDYFVARSGSATRGRGFHRFLAEFLGWDLPDVFTYEEHKRKLYLQYIFPYFFVDQQRGWSNLTPHLPTHFRVKEPHLRAVEFILNLDARRIAAERVEVREEERRVESSWRTAVLALEATANAGGAVAQRLPDRPSSSWPPELPPHLSLPEGKEWVSIDHALAKHEDDLRALVGNDIPRAGEVVEKVAQELTEEQAWLSTAEATLTRLLGELRMERSEADATERRIAKINEDLLRNKDVQLLLELGSKSASHVSEGTCPTCHQDISDSLVPLAEGQQTMPIASNISFLEEQRDAFEGALQNARAIVEAREQQVTAMRRGLDESRARIRTIRQTLVSDGQAPSKIAIRQQVVLEERLGHLRRVSETFEEQLFRLEDLSYQWADVQARKRKLPKKDTSEADLTKLDRWGNSLREQLESYGFRSLHPSELSVSPDTYKATHEGFDLPSNISASDFIRVIWAYLIGLLEVARLCETNHAGLVVFDEPKQQSARDLSFRQLLRRASDSIEHGQQVVFATSESSASIRQMLSGVPHRLFDFDGHIICNLDIPDRSMSNE